jgi:hypothetical protein
MSKDTNKRMKGIAFNRIALGTPLVGMAVGVPRMERYKKRSSEILKFIAKQITPSQIDEAQNLAGDWCKEQNREK